MDKWLDKIGKSDTMIYLSKVDSRIVPCFALPQSARIFGFSCGFAPLHPHIGACHKVIPPLSYKHEVWDDF